MGLIKAGMGAVGGVLGDQWKEFIYCESLNPMCWLPRAESVPLAEDAAPTPAPKTTSLAMAPPLPLMMVNV